MVHPETKQYGLIFACLLIAALSGFVIPVSALITPDVDFSMSPSSGMFMYGDTITFVATVTSGSGTPTGTVTFQVRDGAVLATVPLSSGSATYTTSSLPVGMMIVEAGYNGDTDFDPAFCGAGDIWISRAVSYSDICSLSGDPWGDYAVYGQPVSIIAHVSSDSRGTPTGTMTFYDGTDSLGTVALSYVSPDSAFTIFTTSSLSTGTHSITAEYSGDTYFIVSTSDLFIQTVYQAESTTSVSSSGNPSVAGQPVTFKATVTPVLPGAGTPTGTVTFYDGTASLGTGTLSSRDATLSTSSLSTGTHSITAVYDGDTNFTGSTSSILSQVVQSESTTSISSSANPSAAGQSVTLTATVTPVSPGVGTPTGTVTFYDGTALLGTGTLSSGSATVTTSSLSVGSHSITAGYSGDADFTGSTSDAMTQTVSQASGTTSVSSSVNPSVAGQSVTLTAAVTPVSPGAGIPTGTVTFYDGTASLGTGTLSSGSATFSPSSLSVGSHSITAVYSGDTDFSGSTGDAITQTVNQASGTTSVSSSVNPSVAGQSVTFTATVTPVSPGAGTPTGIVTFYDGAGLLGTGTLSSGSATVTTSSLITGTHSITAVYGGDTDFTGSTSDAMTQTVSQASGTTSVSSSVNPSVYGQSITFTATVTPVSPGAGTPTGTVTFYDGTTSLGTGTLSSGSATFSPSSLSTGTHSITAAYSGDSDFTVSTSSILNQVVQAESTTSVGSSVNPSAAGQSVTFTATVTPVSPGAGIPTGTVTFYDGTASLGTGTLSSGSASFSTSSLSVGTHSITAVYGGDTDFTGSTSDAITQTISQASGTTIPAASASAVTMLDTSENTDDFPSSTIPPMTITVNIGGDSKAWQAIVTGTKLSDLIVTGTVQPGSGSDMTAPPGTVFQYISLLPARYTSITKAVIHFSVPQSWLDENHIDKKSIVLYHQTANGWEALPTTIVSTKDGTVYFSAESTGFSLFAIAGTPTVLTPPVAVATTQGIMSEIVQTPAPAASVKAPVTTQTTAPPATTPQPAAPSPLLNIVLVIAAIGILAGGGFIARRWWIQRQNPALFEDY